MAGPGPGPDLHPSHGTLYSPVSCKKSAAESTPPPYAASSADPYPSTTMTGSLYDQPPAPDDEDFYAIYPEFYDFSNADHSATTGSRDGGDGGQPLAVFSAMGQIEGDYPHAWDYGLGNVELAYSSSPPGIIQVEEGQAPQSQAPFDVGVQAYPAITGDIVAMTDPMSQFISTEESMSGCYELPSWPPPPMGQVSPSPSQSSYYASSPASGCRPHFSRDNSSSSLPASRAAVVDQSRFDARFWPVSGQVVSPGEGQSTPGGTVVNGGLHTVTQSSSSPAERMAPPRRNQWNGAMPAPTRTTTDHTAGTMSSDFMPSPKDSTAATPYQPISQSIRRTPDHQTPKSSGKKAPQSSQPPAQQKHASAGRSQGQQAQPPPPPQSKQRPQPRPQAQPPPTQQQKPPPARRKRSREAANKCRAKAKLAAADLESAERAMGAEHRELSATARGLRDEVLLLKNELLAHGGCDDPPIQEYLADQARVVGGGRTTPAHQRPQHQHQHQHQHQKQRQDHEQQNQQQRQQQGAGGRL